MNSKHKDQAVSKNTYYRFLNETSYNWSKFPLLLAVKVTTAFNSLTRPERVKVLILDDSVIKRNRSKAVELLACSRLRPCGAQMSKGVYTSDTRAGPMDTALFQLDLTCSSRLIESIVTMKYPKVLIIVQMDLNFEEKA